MSGDKMASRVAQSLLKAIGLGEQLTCSSLHEYEERAVALAEDADQLYSLRQHLERARGNCAAFDTARWVRNLENGLTMAWKRHELGLQPDHIDIDDKALVYYVDDAEGLFD